MQNYMVRHWQFALQVQKCGGKYYPNTGPSQLQKQSAVSQVTTWKEEEVFPPSPKHTDFTLEMHPFPLLYSTSTPEMLTWSFLWCLKMILSTTPPFPDSCQNTLDTNFLSPHHKSPTSPCHFDFSHIFFSPALYLSEVSSLQLIAIGD